MRSSSSGLLAEQDTSFATDLLSGNFKNGKSDKKLQDWIDEMEVSDEEPGKSVAGKGSKDPKQSKADRQEKYLAKLEVVSQVVPGDALGASLRKCSQMRTYTTKSLQLLALHLQANPKEKNNFKKLQEQFQEQHSQLDGHIINFTGTTEELKELLMETAKTVKMVNELSTE